MEVDHDPTGGKNFEQFYGMGLGELGCKIAEAHDWGDQFSLGLSVNGEKTLMWYSNRVDRQIVESVLRSTLEAEQARPSAKVIPAAPATGCFSLPQIPNDNGGSPVGSMEVDHDPTGGKNFEQFYGMGLGELGCKIAEAHDWGDQFSLGLSVNGEKTLMWYSNRVDRQIVESVLRSTLEALR